MRAIFLAGVFMAGTVSAAYGQAKDSAIDLADVTDKPVMLTHPDLGYKDCYKDAGLTGTDVVKFVVDTAGHVDPTSVGLTQVTHPILDSLAVRVVRGMVFKPGMMTGAKVRVSVGLPVHFGGGAPPGPPESRVFAESCVDQKAELATGSAFSQGESLPKLMATNPGTVSAQTLRIRVRTLVAPEGNVIQAIVEDAALSAELSQSAVDIARKMRFNPARIAGLAVASYLTVPITVTQVVQVVPNK